MDLIEGLDYYVEDGLLVFTEHYHLRRGYCCRHACRHCPFSDLPRNTDGDGSSSPRSQDPTE